MEPFTTSQRSITDLMDTSLNKFQETVKDREARRAADSWSRQELDTS